MGSLRGGSANNNGFVNLGRATTTTNTGFSIQDAFEEETDEVIKVYGNGGPMASSKLDQEDQEGVKIRMERSDSNRYTYYLSFNWQLAWLIHGHNY